MAAQPNLEKTLEAIELAIVCSQTAQLTGEANPVRLESLRLRLRDERGVVLDMLEEP